MGGMIRPLVLCFLLNAFPALSAQPGTPAPAAPPESWVDPDTGHRVIRLTTEPDSASLYFNQNGYAVHGKNLVFTTRNGISVLDLATREARQIVQGRVRLVEAGRKTARLYFIREGALCFADAETGDTGRIATLPARGSISTINADETLAAGTFIETDGQDYRGNQTTQTRSRPAGQQGTDDGGALGGPAADGALHSEYPDRGDKDDSQESRLAKPPALLSCRSWLADVLPRRPLAQGRPDMDDPY